MMPTTACLLPAFCNCERCKLAHRQQDICECSHKRSSHREHTTYNLPEDRWVCALCNQCTGFRLKEAA
jgi:hypothetical protein